MVSQLGFLRFDTAQASIEDKRARKVHQDHASDRVPKVLRDTFSTGMQPRGDGCCDLRHGRWITRLPNPSLGGAETTQHSVNVIFTKENRQNGWKNDFLQRVNGVKRHYLFNRKETSNKCEHFIEKLTCQENPVGPTTPQFYPKIACQCSKPDVCSSYVMPKPRWIERESGGGETCVKLFYRVIEP